MFKHINLVEVQDLGAINDRLFVVMEMVDGVTLKNLIRQRRLTPQACIKIALQVCSGLDYAHKLTVNGRWLQLVHCDLNQQHFDFKQWCGQDCGLWYRPRGWFHR